MSSRAIAPVVGASYDTVQRDIRADRNLSPATAPRTKTGLDGITALLARAAPHSATLRYQTRHRRSTRTGWTCLLRRRKHADRSSPRLRGPHPADLFLTVPSKIVSAPAWAAHGRATELRLAQVIAPAPTRAAREGRCECPTWTHRLRAYTGGTLLTSTPGREPRCSGTGWLRSAPTGRLAWSPAPTPRLPTPRSPLRWHAD